MRILWITNSIVRGHSDLLGMSVVGGSWLSSELNSLKDVPGLSICAVTTSSVNTILRKKELNVEYIVLPGDMPIQFDISSRKNISNWKEVISNFNPDVVHIHGTEFPFGYSLMKAFPDLKYIISIQGLVSICERYFYAGIRTSELLRNVTIRDLIRRDTVFHARRKYIRRGIIEKMYIESAKHIIGRTTWDHIHSKTINPSIVYHSCNESLRSGFYASKKWSVNTKTSFTIFTIQGMVPIKGLHQLLKAAKLLKKDYPSLKIRIAGSNKIVVSNLRDRLLTPGYFSFLRKLIRRYSLESCIEIRNALNEDEMIKEYLNAHVFVCPSSIENSPNALGEAQILGVPTIASYVGGVPDMVVHEKTGMLYRFDEYEILAMSISQVFENDKFAQKLSSGGIKAATMRHDTKTNLKKLISIYSTVREN